MKKEKYYLGIIIVSKDNIEELSNTLKSIVNHLNEEKNNIYIVGCDKSCDFENVEKIYSNILSSFSFTIFKQKSNGIYNAFNESIEKSKEKVEWIYFLNSGDLVRDKFKKLINFLYSKNNKKYDSIFFRTRCSLYNKKFYVKPTSSSIYIANSKYKSYANKYKFAYYPSHQGIIFNMDFHIKNKYNTSLGIKADSFVAIKAFQNSLYYKEICADYDLGGISSTPKFLRKISYMPLFFAIIRTLRLFIFNFLIYWIIIFDGANIQKTDKEYL